MQQEHVIKLMNDPVAQELLHAAIPARLAYDGTDGFPRVVPVGFHWNGEQIVVGTTTNAYKVQALAANPKVALTIDTNTQPPHVLLVRGTASMEVVDGVPQEYLEASAKLVGSQQMPAFEAQVRSLYDQMVLISITPEWAKVMDFETRIPSNVEEIARERALSSKE